MIEKYYSEKTKKFYDNKSDCLNAEAEYDKVHEAERKEKEVRQKDIKEIEDAYQNTVAARRKYLELIEKFNKKYGRAYRLELTDDYISNIFDCFFNLDLE